MHVDSSDCMHAHRSMGVDEPRCVSSTQVDTDDMARAAWKHTSIFYVMTIRRIQSSMNSTGLMPGLIPISYAPVISTTTARQRDRAFPDPISSHSASLQRRQIAARVERCPRRPLYPITRPPSPPRSSSSSSTYTPSHGPSSPRLRLRPKRTIQR